MTERKPRGMSFTSWIDQQIADAEKRGVFDDLPGAGKPLDLRPDTDADYGQAWMRDYAKREGVTPEEFLPTPLRLRREIQRLGESIGDMRSEQDVREIVGDLNKRILEWRRIPEGPPIFVPLVHMDEMVDRWRAAQAARPSPMVALQADSARQSAISTRPARPRGWRRLLRAKRV
jgi:DnaJ homologue, subfamily C, member 28, conserved domain